MKNKKSFTAYCDWINSFEELSDEEAGKLIKHVLRYVNDLDPKEPDRVTKLMFAPIKSTLKRDLEKWKARCDKNRSNVRKRWNSNVYDRIQTYTKHTDSDSDSDSDKEVLNNIPTLTQVKKYFIENGYSEESAVNAFKYYNVTVEGNKRAKYWKDSKGNNVKNWKQKLRGVWFKEENKIKDGQIRFA